MINCCDGRIVPTPDGGLTLDIGNWQEPSVIIDANAIVGFSDLGRGRDIMTTANTIRATFLDPEQDYQAADADPWVDEADVLERGEIARDVQFNMAQDGTAPIIVFSGAQGSAKTWQIPCANYQRAAERVDTDVQVQTFYNNTSDGFALNIQYYKRDVADELSTVGGLFSVPAGESRTLMTDGVTVWRAL